MSRFFLAAFLILLSPVNLFSQERLLVIRNDMDSPTESFPWINMTTLKQGDAFSGKNYSSTNSSSPFGLGYQGAFPEACRNKNLHILISEYLRTNVIGNEFLMVVSIFSGDSIVFWNSFNVSDRILKKSNWTNIRNEINIPATFTQPNFTFSVYLWNKDGKGVVDIDDLQFDFEEMKIPSFLPEGFVKNTIESGWQKLTARKDFACYYNKEAGNIRFLNSIGDTLIHSLSLVSEWKDDKQEIRHIWSQNFRLKKDSITEEGIYYLLSASNEVSVNEIEILAGNDGNLVFNIHTLFTKDINLFRHALAVQYALPLKEVYKKNTLLDSAAFKSEYWLNKEGFMLSNSKTAFILYHPENVSSIQLNPAGKFALINLDYAMDHPLMHFPLLSKSQGKFEDHSTSLYKAKDKINSSFTFYLSTPQIKFPRMLNNPRGFLSSFVWTEHADFSDLRLHKAVYYGSEKINEPDKAVGGFVGNSIPVTKSYFYSNPENLNNAEKVGFLPGMVESYKEDPAFAVFLKQLYESGYEICLHTPDPNTSNRNLISEALEKNKREFFSSTWIDHGYDNSEKSNRENLMCDGTDSTSNWYCADLWKKYGINYLWNSFYEDTNIFAGYGFNSFFSYPYSGWGDAFPVPVYWRSKTRTADFIHWGTMSTWDPPEQTYWQYFFNNLRLNDLVNNRSSVILHSYPARVDSSSGYYLFKDGVAIANESFNDALKTLSGYRRQSKIWLTTIHEMLDYRLLLEKISFQVQSNGNILLSNTSKSRIAGVTFSVLGNEVYAKDKKIETKVINEELVFWFDMEPGEQVSLLIK